MKLSELNKAMNPLAEVTDGREKMEIKELYGQVATLDKFMFATDDNDKKYAVVCLKEYPKYFHFSGLLETKYLELIADDEELQQELRKGNIKFKYEQGITRKGQRFTIVSVV